MWEVKFYAASPKEELLKFTGPGSKSQAGAQTKLDTPFPVPKTRKHMQTHNSTR